MKEVARLKKGKKKVDDLFSGSGAAEEKAASRARMRDAKL